MHLKKARKPTHKSVPPLSDRLPGESSVAGPQSVAVEQLHLCGRPFGMKPSFSAAEEDEVAAPPLDRRRRRRWARGVSMSWGTINWARSISIPPQPIGCKPAMDTTPWA